eukprot:TRINITY_DN31342_c0_g3_i1.p3 TRINITY_DN31342_c0_g3~~TRINITY_DN31342_c0_g3_i1.p3  ORF type:complete len:207 (+),score=94.68 TRINITY_DN31342_c0_g3_i1:87-707(+)
MLKRTEISEMYGRLVRTAATGGEPTWAIQMVGEVAERGFSISEEIVQFATSQYARFSQQLQNMEEAGYVFDEEAQVVELPGGKTIFPVEVKYGEVQPEYYLQMAKDLEEMDAQLEEEEKEVERMRQMEEEGYAEGEEKEEGNLVEEVVDESVEKGGEEQEEDTWFEGEEEEEEEEISEEEEEDEQKEEEQEEEEEDEEEEEGEGKK